MSFIPIAIVAYILNGFSLIIDKTLVDHSLKSPFVYTFYIGILSLAVLLLVPFGFTAPSFSATVLATLSGILFIMALITFFASLHSFDLTVTSPIVGMINPIVALTLGIVFLNEKIFLNQAVAFFFLSAGGILLTFNLWWGKHTLNRRFLLMIASGFFFGFSYVLLHQAFLAGSFINVLVISRLAMAALVLFFLFSSSTRNQIFSAKLTSHHFANKTSALVLGSQLGGAISGLMITYAVSLASPALVNSVYGVQYIFLLGAAFWLSQKNVHILKEHLDPKSLWQKILATALIGVGLFYLAR